MRLGERERRLRAPRARDGRSVRSKVLAEQINRIAVIVHNENR